MCSRMLWLNKSLDTEIKERKKENKHFLLFFLTELRTRISSKLNTITKLDHQT